MPTDETLANAGAKPILEVRNIWKSFGHVTALKDVSLAARPGEVLALLGDNGAGKSTLVKVLAGVYQPDAGTYKLDGKIVERASVANLRRLGIAAVFQDLGLVETLDIAANMFLGQPIKRWGVLANRRAMLSRSAEALRDAKVRIPSIRVPVGELSGGQRQGVAIARALLQDTPVLLMDEPTAALGVRETRQVGETIDTLRSQGKAIILISHDMGFVFTHSDRIQVLRLGQMRGARITAQTDQNEIVGLITGAVGPDNPESFEQTVFGNPTAKEPRRLEGRDLAHA